MSKEGTQPGQIPITGFTLIRFAFENRLDRVKNTLRLLGSMKGPQGMEEIMIHGEGKDDILDIVYAIDRIGSRYPDATEYFEDLSARGPSPIHAVLLSQSDDLESKKSILRLFLKFVVPPGDFQQELEYLIDTVYAGAAKDQLLAVAREPRTLIRPSDLKIGGRRRKTRRHHRRGRKHTRKH